MHLGVDTSPKLGVGRPLPGSPGLQARVHPSDLGSGDTPECKEAHVAGVFSRISSIFQAKANKVLDKAEDPRETLDLSYEKQLAKLTEVRKAVADVATSRKRIELQAAELKKQADKLQGQAKAALEQGNEDLAREALLRREALAEQLSSLEAQHTQIAEKEADLIEVSKTLQTKIEEFRTRKETIKASYTAAEAQTKISEAVTGISDSMGDAGQAMNRAQDKIAQMEARAGAMDELISSGALTDLSQPVDDIQAQLDKVAAASSVDAELAALKSQLGQGTAGEIAAPATDEAGEPSA